MCNVYRLEFFFAGKSIRKHTMCVCYFMYKEWMPYSADCSISIFKLCTRSLHVYIQNTNALKLYNMCNKITIIWDSVQVFTKVLWFDAGHSVEGCAEETTEMGTKKTYNFSKIWRFHMLQEDQYVSIQWRYNGVYGFFVVKNRHSHMTNAPVRMNLYILKGHLCKR